ncbi:MAG: hypothetical protein IPI31_11755 [Bacteroidetes bacterium]|nr:hypothetical protein [Bacteroidota bacterium]
MKFSLKFICIIFLFSINLLVYGQIKVHYYSKSVFAENIETLKKTTLVFVVTDNYKDSLDVIEKALEKSWTLTKYEVITYDELKYYVNEDGYSYMKMQGFLATPKILSTVYFELQLKVENSDKTKITWKPIAYMNLYIDRTNNTEGIEKGEEYLYEIQYHNYNAGFLKLFVKTINDYILAGKPIGEFDTDISIPSEVEKLKMDTLYIPDYTLKLSKKYVSESKFKVRSHEEFLEDYPYEATILSADELGNKILNGSIDYALIYTSDSELISFMVYNVKTGELIYGKFLEFKENLKSKDLLDIFEEN